MRKRLLIALLVVACTPARAPDTQAVQAPQPAQAQPELGPPFPRIASYRIEATMDRDAQAMLSRIPLAIVDAEVGALVPDVLRRIRAQNASLELLAYLTSEEIKRDPDPEQPLAAIRFSRIPGTAWLTDPGSVLASDIDAKTTRIRVRDPKAFALYRPPSQFYGPREPTYLLVEDEHMRLLAIEGDTLVVQRGFRSQPTRHAAGTRIASHVVFFEGTWMLDITSSWRDLLADEAAALVGNGIWTGVFLDVCFEDVSFLNGGVLDIDRDGRADDRDRASRVWKTAFGTLVGTLRARLGPNVPIVANPGAQDCPHPELDGILLEGFPIGLPPEFLAFETGFARYLRWTNRPGRRPLSVVNAYSPKIGFGTIQPGQDDVARTDYRAMRFGLAVALMGNGYYAFDNGVFGHYVAWWYDEYDGAGRGVGWLGYPQGPPQKAGAAYVRRFTNGLAIANPSNAPVTVAVPPGYRKLAGRQDPEHNNGDLVRGAISVPPRDGYLLRFSVEPKDATITIDGAPVTGDELVVEADGDEHTLTVAATGYKPHTEKLHFDQSQKLVVHLRRAAQRTTTPKRPVKPSTKRERIESESPYQ